MSGPSGADDQRILVAGAAGGIGRAAAIALTRLGVDVVAADVRADALRDVPAVERLALDVTRPDSVADVIGQAGPLTGLVNAVGRGFWAPVEIVPLEDVKALFDINLFGAIAITQAVLPGLREHGGGLIVHVTSVGARTVNPASGYYAATKIALEAICEALRMETRHLGVRVCVIEPGAVATEIGDRRYVSQPTGGAYAELMNLMSGAFTNLDKIDPQEVGDLIAQVATTQDPMFRWPIPDSAARAVAQRLLTDDATHEHTIRERFSLPT